MTGAMPSAPRASQREDLASARALLSDAGLPLAGLDEHFAGFWTLDTADGGLAGLAGAERYGDAWLLRSLVVHRAFQGRGHGRALLETVLTEAGRAGAREVFLLTTDAQRFFAAQGFDEVARASAPAALQASAELRGACPYNATLMRLEIAP
jgi:N-acetylglutamate synthase-like GNAT family acetyltransferase